MATASPSSESETARGPAPAGCRGQVSPTAALVAVAAIGMGISLHATVLSGTVTIPEQDVAGPTLDGVHDAVVTAGVADPERLAAAAAAGPAGYRLRVTLTADGSTWSTGPSVPSTDRGDGVQTAERRVAVRTAPGTVRVGSLRVEVWR